MPVRKGSGGKWKIGNGPSIYTSKKSAQRANRAVNAKKYGKK